MRSALIAALAAACCLPVLADEEVETFDDGFVNPFFTHDFEFDDACCWSFGRDPNDPNNGVLHLHPNFDVVTFDLPAGMRVHSVSVRLYDLEGGFVGDQPTSIMGVRASDGNFVTLGATAIGVWTELSASIETIGRIGGEPLGDIVSVDFQAANEGNSLIPGVGAMYDDLTVVLECIADTDRDGDIDSDDFFTYLDQFTAGEDIADIDRDGDLDTDDFFAFLDLFTMGC